MKGCKTTIKLLLLRNNNDWSCAHLYLFGRCASPRVPWTPHPPAGSLLRRPRPAHLRGGWGGGGGGGWRPVSGAGTTGRAETVQRVQHRRGRKLHVHIQNIPGKVRSAGPSVSAAGAKSGSWRVWRLWCVCPRPLPAAALTQQCACARASALHFQRHSSLSLPLHLIPLSSGLSLSFTPTPYFNVNVT